MSGLRQTPLHRALYRQPQILGCDRMLAIIAFTFSALMIAGCMDLVGIVCGMSFASFSLYALRRMAKADPMMREVYLRQIQYGNYYHPFSRPFRRSKEKRVY